MLSLWTLPPQGDNSLMAATSQVVWKSNSSKDRDDFYGFNKGSKTLYNYRNGQLYKVGKYF